MGGESVGWRALHLVPLLHVAQVDGRWHAAPLALAELGDPGPHEQREGKDLGGPEVHWPGSGLDALGSVLSSDPHALDVATPCEQDLACEDEEEAAIDGLANRRAVGWSRPPLSLI